MSTSDFDRIWQQVQALSDAERHALQELLLRHRAKPADGEEELETRLVSIGVLTPPRTRAAESWQPISIVGIPLSQTLLEDRR